jgi:uracil phosphoribosyltransferase
MLATGNSSIAAINLIKSKDVNIKDVFLVSLLAAQEGIKNLQKHHRSQTQQEKI